MLLLLLLPLLLPLLLLLLLSLLLLPLLPLLLLPAAYDPCPQNCTCPLTQVHFYMTGLDYLSSSRALTICRQ